MVAYPSDDASMLIREYRRIVRERKTTMPRLPFEILSGIFRHNLSPGNLFTCSLVCRAWNELATSALWTHPRWTLNNIERVAQSTLNMKHVGPNWRSTLWIQKLKRIQDMLLALDCKRLKRVCSAAQPRINCSLRFTLTSSPFAK